MWKRTMPGRRVQSVAVLVAGAAVCALSAAPAAAFHIAGATYNGTHSEGGTVSLTVTPDGSGISRFAVTGPIQGNSCTFSGSETNYTTPLPIVNHGFADTTAPFTANGTFGGVQRASGTFRISTGPPYPCSSQTLTWTATTTADPAGSQECQSAKQAVAAAEEKVKKAKKKVKKADSPKEKKKAKKKLKKAKKKLAQAKQSESQVC